MQIRQIRLGADVYKAPARDFDSRPSSSDHMSEHSQDQTTTQQQGPQPEGPALELKHSLQALDWLLSSGRPNPDQVAAIVKAHPRDAEQIYTKLMTTLGMDYTKRVVASAGVGTVPRADGLPENDKGVEDQRTSHEGKWKGGVNVKDQTATLGKTTTDEAVNGEDSYKATVTNTATVGKAANGGYGAAVNHATTTATEDHGVSTDKARNIGGGVNTKGVNIAAGHDATMKANGVGNGTGHDVAAGVNFDGSIDVDAAKKSVKIDAQGEHTKKSNLGWGDGGLKGGHSSSHTQEVHNPDGTTGKKTDSTAVTGGINKDGLTGNLATNHVSGTGTTSGANAGGTVGKDGYSGHAGYSLMTKGGSGVHMSVSHGTKVTAEPMKWVDDHWEVSYVRVTTTGGEAGGSVGGGGFGVGLGGGTESKHFDSGVRRFINPLEAADFQVNAAERLVPPMFAPNTLVGALSIPIGESRGAGDSTALSANGSLSFEGASVGAGAKETTTHELNIRRVDAQHVDVTMTTSGEDEHEHHISGNMLTDTVSKTDRKNKAITWRFDLFDQKSSDAFAKYCKDRVAPAKGTARWMSTDRMMSHEDQDDIKLAGLDNSYKSTTTEDHLLDEKGSHDTYDGTKSQDISAGFFGKHLFGDADAHASATLESKVENGKDAGYAAVLKFSGDSGEHNREAMNELFMMGNAKKHDAKASGEWTVSADISQHTIDELEKYPLFKNAKTPEDKHRALSKFIAERGADGFGGLGYVGGKSLEWDVELKGDKNFPGKAGQVALEHKIESFDKQLNAGSDPQLVYAEVDLLIKEQASRFTEVDDRDKYTDLPDGLRDKVLDQIRHNLLVLKNYRGNIGQEAMAAHHDTGDPTLDGMQTEMDTLNQQMKKDNHLIMRYDQAIGKAKAVQIQSTNHAMDAKISEQRGNAGSFRTAAFAANEDETTLEPQIQLAREQYLKATDKMVAAKHLLDLTRKQADDMRRAVLELQLAAAEIKPFTTPNGIKGFEDVWSEVPGEVGEDAAITNDDA